MKKLMIFLSGMFILGSAVAETIPYEALFESVGLDKAISAVTIDTTQVASAIQALVVDLNMDDLVSQSLHDSDRRFSGIG